MGNLVIQNNDICATINKSYVLNKNAQDYY